MDKSLNLTKNNFVLCVLSVISVILSVISAVNGGPLLLTAAAVLMCLYCMPFMQSRPYMLVLPSAVSVIYFAVRIIGVYIRGAFISGISALASATFAAMLVCAAAFVLVTLCVTGYMKNTYIAEIVATVAILLSYYIFIKAMGFGGLITFAFFVPIAFVGIYYAFKRDNNADIFYITAVCYIICAVISAVKNCTAGDDTLLSTVLLIVSAVGTGIIFAYLKCLLKSFFAMLAAVLFCITVSAVVLLLSANPDWGNIKYYFMYMTYITLSMQLAVLIGNMDRDR